jgi:hypothetical protein
MTEGKAREDARSSRSRRGRCGGRPLPGRRQRSDFPSVPFGHSRGGQSRVSRRRGPGDRSGRDAGGRRSDHRVACRRLRSCLTPRRLGKDDRRDRLTRARGRHDRRRQVRRGSRREAGCGLRATRARERQQDSTPEAAASRPADACLADVRGQPARGSARRTPGAFQPHVSRRSTVESDRRLAARPGCSRRPCSEGVLFRPRGGLGCGLVASGAGVHPHPRLYCRLRGPFGPARGRETASSLLSAGQAGLGARLPSGAVGPGSAARSHCPKEESDVQQTAAGRRSRQHC